MSLSEGGAYVATPVDLLPQSQLEVSIEVPELERTFRVEAVVAWENRGERRPSAQPEGYGLRFLRVSHPAKQAIRWMLRHDEREVQKQEQARHRELEKELADRLATEEKAKAKDERRVSPTRTLYTEEIEEAFQRARAATPPGAWDTGVSDVAAAASLSDDTASPPFPLEPAHVNARVPESTPGVFILSYDRAFDALVGRADADLRSSLEQFYGQYSYFHFEPVPSRKDRFERECELFHRLGGDRGQLDNREHPLPPAGPQLKCPVCVKERLAER
jgi:hypothetical protein